MKSWGCLWGQLDTAVHDPACSLLKIVVSLPLCLLTVQTTFQFTCWLFRQPAILPVDSWDSLLFCLLTAQTACCFACWQLRQPVLPVDSWDSLLFCLLAVETACCFACWQLRQPAVLPVDSSDSLLFCLLTVGTHACCFSTVHSLLCCLWVSLVAWLFWLFWFFSPSLSLPLKPQL